MIADMIPIQYRMMAIAGVVAVAAATAGATGWKLNGWRLGAQIKTLETEHAQAVSDSEKLATAASETYRREEQRLNSKVKDAENVLSQTTASNARIADGLRSDNGRLRKSVADFAAGSSPASDTVAAARDRAQSIGLLLDAALQTSEESAGDGESCESGLRAVLSAWPEAELGARK